MPSFNSGAILSGALGATASFIAKLALTPDSPVPSTIFSFCTTYVNQQSNVESLSWVCPSVSLATRGICLLCMIGVNAIMISSFLEGMDESGSVVGTALSTAANFSCSAVYGIIFFGEIVSISWYFGAVLIAVGMWVLSSVTLVESEKPKKQ